MKNLDYITCKYVEEILKEELSSPKEKNNSHYESIGALAEALENLHFTNKQIERFINGFFVSVVKGDVTNSPLTALRGNCLTLIVEAIALTIRVDEAIATVKNGCDNQ